MFMTSLTFLPSEPYFMHILSGHKVHFVITCSDWELGQDRCTRSSATLENVSDLSLNIFVQKIIIESKKILTHQGNMCILRFDSILMWKKLEFLVLKQRRGVIQSQYFVWGKYDQIFQHRLSLPSRLHRHPIVCRRWSKTGQMDVCYRCQYFLLACNQIRHRDWWFGWLPTYAVVLTLFIRLLSLIFCWRQLINKASPSVSS